jgi:hypothetical protein
MGFEGLNYIETIGQLSQIPAALDGLGQEILVIGRDQPPRPWLFRARVLPNLYLVSFRIK